MGKKMSRSSVLAQRRIKHGLSVALGRGDDERVVELYRLNCTQRSIAEKMDYRGEFSLGVSSSIALVCSILTNSALISHGEHRKIAVANIISPVIKVFIF